MILTVEELRAFIDTEETDQGLALRLQALEAAIQGHTHNNFREYRDKETGEIHYPADIKLGVIEMLKWDLTSREKTGIASESLSRHSVSYQALDGTNTINGYPAIMMGFLRPYMMPYFGQGLRKP